MGKCLQAESPGREIFFRCPKCGHIFSTTKASLEQDKYAKASLTRLFLGGRLSLLAPSLKCTECSGKLERISREEFEHADSSPNSHH